MEQQVVSCRRRWRDLSLDRWALIAVAAIAAAAQIRLIGHLWLGPDESVYASQVSPVVPPSFLSAPRARGTSWLVAPILQVSNDLFIWRVYLAVVAAVALVVALWPWVRLLPRWVPAVAAAGFSSMWATVFYAPSLMPNYWVAVAGLAATGWLLRTCAGQRWALLPMTFAIVAATLLRPNDAAWLVVGLIACAVLLPGPRRIWTVAATIGAAVVGALPWVIEAETSYGGVRARLDQSSHLEGGLHLQAAFVYAVRSVDGPLLCRPCRGVDVATPWSGYLWLVGPVALIGIGVHAAWRLRYRRAVGVALVVAATSATPYLLLVGYGAPRFLLPTYALLAIPAGLGVVSMWRRWRGRWWVVPAFVVALAVLFAASQATVLQQRRAGAFTTRDVVAQQMELLAEHGLTPPCAVVGPKSNMRSMLSGCQNVASWHPLQSLEQRTGDNEAAAVILASGRPRPTALAGWTEVPFPGKPGRTRSSAYLSPRCRYSPGPEVTEDDPLPPRPVCRDSRHSTILRP